VLLIRGGHVAHTLLAPLTGELSVFMAEDESNYGLPSRASAVGALPRSNSFTMVGRRHVDSP
jgi:hypothetical protein